MAFMYVFNPGSTNHPPSDIGRAEIDTGPERIAVVWNSFVMDHAANRRCEVELKTALLVSAHFSDFSRPFARSWRCQSSTSIWSY